MSEHSLPIAIASEEEWRVTMRYADEHAGEFGGPNCHCDNKHHCEAEHPTDYYYCTEPRGHAGPHIACSSTTHHCAEWPNEFSPAKAPRSDFGAFLFDMCCDMNRALAEQVRKERP